MLHLGLIVTNLKANRLILLCNCVKHSDLEFSIVGLRIIPLLSYSSNDLFALMHFLDANLHQILLVHLD